MGKRSCVGRVVYGATQYTARMNFKAFAKQHGLTRLNSVRVPDVLESPRQSSSGGGSGSSSSDGFGAFANSPIATPDDAAAAAAASVNLHQAALDRLAHTISTVPLDAMRAMDVWSSTVKQVAASTSTLEPRFPGMHVQFEECVVTAKLWQDFRAAVQARCVSHVVPALEMGCASGCASQTPSAAQLTSEVDDTVAAFKREYTSRGWLYHTASGMLFEPMHGGAHVQICSTLIDALRETCVATGAHAALVLNIAVGKAHDMLLATHRTLRIDSRVVLFQDTVVTMAPDGLSLCKCDVLPALRAHGAEGAPVAARALLQEPFAYDCMGSHGGTHAAAPPDVLLEVLGAVLRPSMLRREDLRPVCVLLTAPAHSTHPWAAAIQALVGLSMLQYTPGQDVGTPAAHDPYVLCVNSTQRALDAADVAALHVALARNMVVVLVSAAPPAVLLHGDTDSIAFLRLVTVHVPSTAVPLSPPSPARLLMQSQTAYNRGKLRGAAHAFLTDVPALAFRLAYTHTAQTLLVEMLQASHGGLALCTDAVTSLAAIQAQFAVYSAARCGAGVPACSPQQVLDALHSFRNLFGQSAAYPVGAYDARRALFRHVKIQHHE